MKLQTINIFLCIIFMRLIFISPSAFAQISYYKKAELCYLNYRESMVRYDLPDPNWKGPPLNDQQNGLCLSFISGLSFFNNKVNTGLGIGYLNFQGINGGAAFGEIEIRPIDEKFAPFINIRLGYSHIWNQYENGQGSVLSNFEGGFYYKISKAKSIYTKTGILFTQEVLFFPISLGIVF